MSEFTVPVAFQFSVRFEGENAFDMAFQEVSGLETEPDGDVVAEGGENRFVHKLPAPPRRRNIILKRGLTEKNSDLISWCNTTLGGGFDKPIEPKDITVSLVDKNGDAVAEWTVSNAFPVKWSAGHFDAMTNQLAIEAIELSYNQSSRTR